MRILKSGLLALGVMLALATVSYAQQPPLIGGVPGDDGTGWAPRIRAVIDQFRGREMATLGDGFLALFDGPARAVRAATSMDHAVADLGLRLRVGIHTGEVEIVGGQARGLAVHTAARVASLAGAGEVIVSGTTHDLLEGSGLFLEPHGEHELKGLSGKRSLFALRR